VESFEDGTKEVRKYMLEEAELQYRDYYESDNEEETFFEYMDTMSYRDRIRLVEVFEDFTVKKTHNDGFKQIPRRETNHELSIFQNLQLDLQDYNERVKPMAQDMAHFDKAHKFQRMTPEEATAHHKEFYSGVRGERAFEAEPQKTLEEPLHQLEPEAESSEEIVENTEEPTEESHEEKESGSDEEDKKKEE